ncbi:hypothetical protein BGX28_004533, partial [Mortierella sp. GBA30]
MSKNNATIIAVGKGNAKITFYDNGLEPTDSEQIETTSDDVYIFTVGQFRNDVKKYGFSLENQGFKNLTVSYADKTYDLTSGSNNTGFDFWGQKTFTPTKTETGSSQHVGGVVYVTRY